MSAQGTIGQACSVLLERHPRQVSGSQPSPPSTCRRLRNRFPPTAIVVGCPPGWEYSQGPPSRRFSPPGVGVGGGNIQVTRQLTQCGAGKPSQGSRGRREGRTSLGTGAPHPL